MRTDEEWERLRAEWALETRAIESRVPGLRFHNSANELFPQIKHANPRGYGGACPWQAEGTIDGRPFYARFRGDTASISVWDVDAADVVTDRHGMLDLDYKDTVWSSVIGNFTGEPYAGSLNGVDEIVSFFHRLINELRPTDPDTNPNSTMVLAAFIESYSESLKK